jgi:hypothetical protein
MKTLYVSKYNDCYWQHPFVLELFDFEIKKSETFIFYCNNSEEYKEFLNWRVDNGIKQIKGYKKHSGYFCDSGQNHKQVRQALNQGCPVIGDIKGNYAVIIDVPIEDALLIKLTW